MAIYRIIVHLNCAYMCYSLIFCAVHVFFSLFWWLFIYIFHFNYRNPIPQIFTEKSDYESNNFIQKWKQLQKYAVYNNGNNVSNGEKMEKKLKRMHWHHTYKIVYTHIYIHSRTHRQESDELVHKLNSKKVIINWNLSLAILCDIISTWNLCKSVTKCECGARRFIAVSIDISHDSNKSF